MQRRVSGFKSVLLVALLCSASAAQASHEAVYTDSYGEIVGRKVLSGMGNLTTSALEIPKSIVIVNNQTNFIWGVFGGTLKGLVNTIGRIGVGIADLVTAPIPTYPIVSPEFVWDDFYTETTYGPAFVWQEPR